MKTFTKYHEAVAALLDGEAQVACHGRVFEREDALVSLGYDGAKARGLLDEYKQKILGTA